MTESTIQENAQKILHKKFNRNDIRFGSSLIGFSHFDVTGAKSLFNSLFLEQSDSGRIPHSKLLEGVELPIFGFVLLKIYEIAEEKKEMKTLLKECYFKIHAFHQYLYTHRDSKDEGLISIYHPMESGMESAPTFDSFTEGMPFEFQEPLFNALLSWSNESMIEVGRIIGADVTDFVLWNELTVFSMNEKLWDEAQGIYNAFDVLNKQLIPGETLAGLLPIIADIPTLEQAENILRNIEDEFFSGTKKSPSYLCPTYDITGSLVDYNSPWRGGVRLDMNWLLYQGLDRFEMTQTANKLKSDSLSLLAKYGFREFYDSRKHSEELKKGRQENEEAFTAAAVFFDFTKI